MGSTIICSLDLHSLQYMHSYLHNFPIETRLELSLGNISECFACLDKYFSGIWAWSVDAIVDELGSFTLIGFSDISLKWTIVVRASR